MRILLPVDDSPYSQQALRTLIAQIHARGTQVRVLHVVEPVAAYVTAGLVPELVYQVEDVEKDRRKQAQALVKRTAEKLRKAGFTASEVVDTGDPKTIIVEHAEEWRADLIVVGSHGLKGISRFLMGSVSEAVVRHAGCSVEVVRSRRAGKRPSGKKK